MTSFSRMAGYIGAEPFRPFRITMASGHTFEIRHPEMIAVNRTFAVIYTYLSEDPEQAKQREYQVSLLLMESVELLSVIPAASEPT
ncbi:MAG: hypothetical protein ACRC7O_09195 [Fimbriiglobus sp.]